MRGDVLFSSERREGKGGRETTRENFIKYSRTRGPRAFEDVRYQNRDPREPMDETAACSSSPPASFLKLLTPDLPLKLPMPSPRSVETQGVNLPSPIQIRFTASSWCLRWRARMTNGVRERRIISRPPNGVIDRFANLYSLITSRLAPSL